MSTSFPSVPSNAADEVQNLRRDRNRTVGLGVALILVGSLAIGYHT